MNESPELTPDFCDLFDRLYPSAVRLASRITGGVDAEDMAAEAFARALANWDSVGKLGHVDKWVLRVTANLSLDRIRRRKYHRFEPIELAFDAGVEDTSPALAVTLREALRRLPRRQAQVVTLRYLFGLSELEVAGTLGVSLGSVKTHARRGLHAIRKSLQDHREELFDVG